MRKRFKLLIILCLPISLWGQKNFEDLFKPAIIPCDEWRKTLAEELVAKQDDWSADSIYQAYRLHCGDGEEALRFYLLLQMAQEQEPRLDSLSKAANWYEQNLYYLEDVASDGLWQQSKLLAQELSKQVNRSEERLYLSLLQTESRSEFQNILHEREYHHTPLASQIRKNETPDGFIITWNVASHYLVQDGSLGLVIPSALGVSAELNLEFEGKHELRTGLLFGGGLNTESFAAREYGVLREGRSGLLSNYWIYYGYLVSSGRNHRLRVFAGPVFSQYATNLSQEDAEGNEFTVSLNSFSFDLGLEQSWRVWGKSELGIRASLGRRNYEKQENLRQELRGLVYNYGLFYRF